MASKRNICQECFWEYWKTASTAYLTTSFCSWQCETDNETFALNQIRFGLVGKK